MGQTERKAHSDGLTEIGKDGDEGRGIGTEREEGTGRRTERKRRHRDRQRGRHRQRKKHASKDKVLVRVIGLLKIQQDGRRRTETDRQTCRHTGRDKGGTVWRKERVKEGVRKKKNTEKESERKDTQSHKRIQAKLHRHPQRMRDTETKRQRHKYRQTGFKKDRDTIIDRLQENQRDGETRT